MTALLAAIAYFAIGLVAARLRYQKIRPYSEPLSCEYQSIHHKREDHIDSCYVRYGDVDGPLAMLYALLTGLVWPFILPAMAVARFVKAGARQLPEELAAEIKRLEAENEQLRRQQERLG